MFYYELFVFFLINKTKLIPIKVEAKIEITKKCGLVINGKVAIPP